MVFAICTPVESGVYGIWGEWRVHIRFKVLRAVRIDARGLNLRITALPLSLPTPTSLVCRRLIVSIEAVIARTSVYGCNIRYWYEGRVHNHDTVRLTVSRRTATKKFHTECYPPAVWRSDKQGQLFKGVHCRELYIRRSDTAEVFGASTAMSLRGCGRHGSSRLAHSGSLPTDV